MNKSKKRILKKLGTEILSLVNNWMMVDKDVRIVLIWTLFLAAEWCERCCRGDEHKDMVMVENGD